MENGEEHVGKLNSLTISNEKIEIKIWVRMFSGGSAVMVEIESDKDIFQLKKKLKGDELKEDLKDISLTKFSIHPFFGLHGQLPEAFKENLTISSLVGLNSYERPWIIYLPEEEEKKRIKEEKERIKEEKKRIKEEEKKRIEEEKRNEEKIPKSKLGVMDLHKHKFYLNSKDLFFVNRENAIEEMLEVFHSNYIRAKDGIGEVYKLPYADHSFGVGKTSLGRYFVPKVNMMEPKSSIAKMISKCVTVRIVMTANSLDFNDMVPSFISLLISEFKESFDGYFEKKFTIIGLLKYVVSGENNLFLHIDEIAVPFEVSDDPLQNFFSFQKNCLLDVLSVPGVFLFLSGKSSFLSLGMRNVTKSDSSPIEIKRIPINLLREEKIKLVLENTLLSETNTRTVASAIDYEDKDLLANYISKVTAGNPRSILNLLQNLVTKKRELVEDCIKVDVNLNSIDNFCKNVSNYPVEVIKKLLDVSNNKSVIDLRQFYQFGATTDNLKAVTYEVIVNDLNIQWNNTLDEATLYIPVQIENILRQYSLPLYSYLISLMAGIDVNYPLVFEKLILKAEQTLTNNNTNLLKTNIPFFEGTLIGEISFSCSLNIIETPKMTNYGKAKPITLQALESNVKFWPDILDMIEFPCSLMPKPQSHSFDSASFGSLNSLSDEFKRRFQEFHRIKNVAILRANKNYKVSEFGIDMLLDEIEKSNKMAIHLDKSYFVSLVVYSTRYQQCIVNWFKKEENNVKEAKNFLVTLKHLKNFVSNQKESNKRNERLGKIEKLNENCRIDEIILFNFGTQPAKGLVEYAQVGKSFQRFFEDMIISVKK